MSNILSKQAQPVGFALFEYLPRRNKKGTPALGKHRSAKCTTKCTWSSVRKTPGRKKVKRKAKRKGKKIRLAYPLKKFKIKQNRGVGK